MVGSANCGRSPTNAHQDFAHRFNSSVHFLLFDKLATLCRRYTFVHGGKETGFPE
jgi:hypothetical protein